MHRPLPAARRGFSLVELLVVIAVIALLVAVLIPTLALARGASQSAQCLGNLRQIGIAFRLYADDHNGLSPALGQPYAGDSNWGIVALRYSGREGATVGDLYTPDSVIVCPSAQQDLSTEMVRTYAVNATGHAGQAGDPDDYDDPANPAYIRLDRVSRPEARALVIDSDYAGASTNPPPTSRTAGVIDFRQANQLDRVGYWHGGGDRFNTLLIDGSARPFTEIPDLWLEPLP